MPDPLRHLPFLLVLFIVLFTGLTDAAVDAGPRVLVTLLAPTLWLGLYLLGADRAPGTDGGRVPKSSGEHVAVRRENDGAGRE